MKLAAVIDMLRHCRDDLRPLGVSSLYLYGSTARDEAGPHSDVDVFVDPDYDHFSFVELIRLEKMLAGVLGRKVDVTTREGLHPLLKREIERDAIQVL